MNSNTYPNTAEISPIRARAQKSSLAQRVRPRPCHNGVYDASAGETDWKTYTSQNKLVGSPAIQVYTPLK